VLPSASAHAGAKARSRSLLRQSFDEREEDLKHLLSFEGSVHLLRGSDLSTVMRRRGHIFADSRGSASTYNLSESVRHLDAFISHNWSVPRFQKYLCLALHFNLRLAVVAAFLATAALGALNSLGLLPTVRLNFTREDERSLGPRLRGTAQGGVGEEYGGSCLNGDQGCGDKAAT